MSYIYHGEENFFRELRKRVFWITFFIFVAFVTIIIRLWYLQVLQGDSLKKRAESNRLRQVTLADLRGRLYDRNGIELVSSRASFNAVLIREDVPDLDEVLDRLGGIISFDKKKTAKKILSVPPFVSYVIARDISRNEAARIEEQRYELPGVSLEILSVRDYRYGSLGAHLIGYLGEISRKELASDAFAGYKQGEIIGKYGLEKQFEPVLRGRRGKKIVEVDAAGRELELVRNLPSVAGKDVFLSIDYKTQVAAEKAIEGKRGAIVALKPATGEIIAMVSAPAFNPNRFTLGVERGYWNQLINDEYHPLNNRAIQGLYAPASTYKIVVASAGLAEGVIDENTTFFCPGYYRLGRKVYRCWRRGGHGKVKLEEALAQSCDVYFYQLGLKLGVDKIANTAKKFGLGKISGINLEHEKSGLIPTAAWKEKHRNEKWIAGETLSIAIGQGFNLVTPLQMARVISAVASGGWMPDPHLTRLAEDDNAEEESPGGHFVGLSKEHMELIRNGLLAVVYSRRGTARHARLPGIKVAGKTGTAQVVRLKKEDLKRKIEDIPEEFRDHAWFVAFAPFENPEIAVAVIVEHGGHGSTTAAPIAREVMKVYLEGLANSPTEQSIADGETS